MIGDWVYRVDFKEPIPVRILGLEVVNYDTHPKQYIADVFCPKHKNNVGLYMDEICPITLTAEILEKNGFELYEQDFTSDKVYLFDKGFTYIEDCGNYFVIGANVEYEHFGRKLRFISSTIKVYYVHELQHALRLAGIDKEIKL